MKEYYRREWRFFKSGLGAVITWVALAYLILIVLSFIYNSAYPDATFHKLDEIKKVLEAEILLGQSSFQLFIDLFLHNFLASILSTLAGLVPLLFLPVFSIIFNAYIFGLVTAVLYLTGENIALALVSTVAPHGILEIPAFFYAAGLGLYFTLEINKRIFRPHRARLISGNDLLEHFLSSYVLIIIPLLLAAAFTEAYITPQVYHLLQ